MTKPGRIPCINPTCRRTAAKDDDPETEIICGKCFRALPIALRGRYQQLSRREKRLLRLADRGVTRGVVGPDRVRVIAQLIETARAKNWDAVRTYFRRPDKPVGLEGFLQEVGL